MLRRVLAVAPLGCVLVLACASPTLPLPPPLAPSVTQGTDAHHFKLTAMCGGAEGGALIVIENTDTSIPNDQRVSGSITAPCGSWDATVYANRGDVLSITQDNGAVSLPATVQISLQ